ncbi:MAG TPA: RNA pseudouridine synthase [Bryobacteraceae bacterium]|nr:RNA pseudouridine synthase [Bryobacteraceae bacterium]
MIPRESEGPKLLTPEILDECLLERTDEWIVLNKPPGFVCHPSRSGPWSSIVGACREHFGIERLHMPSRLDRETSGVLVLAVNPEAGKRLQHAVGRGDTQKTYTAVLEGTLDSTVVVNAAIGKAGDEDWHSRQGVRQEGQASVTEFTPLTHAPGYTLVRVHPLTGRRHQIRVHAAHIGHPVVGDKLYGRHREILPALLRGDATEAEINQLPIQRHALHATEILFRTPEGELRFRAPLYTDILEFWTSAVQSGV